MKNNKGITLISLVVTVILLALIAGFSITAGINTYENSKVVRFETYMKMLQKKVDIMLEEDIDYTTVGSALTSTQQNTLQTILNNDSSNYIETEDATSETLRFFNSTDIQSVFEIDNVSDEIVINFSNREVISLKGVEKNGVMYYVEKGLN